MLSPEQQVEFVGESPEVFLPVAGGWGRNGATHVRLAEAGEDVLHGALHTAWKRRFEMNAKAGKGKGRRAGAALASASTRADTTAAKAALSGAKARETKGSRCEGWNVKGRNSEVG